MTATLRMSIAKAVLLEQVNAFDHAGTLADPYIAHGLVFDGCYPFAG